jgi:cytochrome P450
MADAAAEVAYNPFEPGFAANPYPQYEALRDQDPVHQSPLGIWILFRYDDVRRVLRDHSLSVEDRNARPGPMAELRRELVGDRVERGSHAMLNRDPPAHTRLRRLVSKVFTPRAVERLRPRIEALVDDALDRAEDQGGLDLIAELAFPLPFVVISEMLGMPEVDRDQLRSWSGTLVRALEPMSEPEVMLAIAEAGDNMRELVSGIIDDKRSAPADDLLSALITAEDQGDVLSDEELLDQVMLLYIAGHETTVNLIGNGTLALLHHRSELARLRSDPGLARPAVDELLRYDSPVQMSRRITLADIEIGGRTIEAGTFVGLMLASGNRDPRHWGDDADVVRLDRRDADQHLSFGGGAHHCLGAALARLEGEVAIGRLVRRFPRLDLAGEPTWNGRINLRGLDRLPLSTGA